MIADLRIEGLAAGGDGVARADGLVTFVPHTAVGDVARVRVESHGRFARGRLQEVLVPSPDRVTAPCVHFTHDACGGCQWQHLGLAAQRAAKAAIVADAFARIASVPILRPEVQGDTQAFGYRRTVRFTVRETPRGLVGGFHAGDDPDVIVPIERCLLAHPDLQNIWSLVRERLGTLPTLTPTVAPSVTTANGGSARRATGRGARRTERDRRRTAPALPSLRVTLRRLEDGGVAVAVEGGARWPSSRRRAFVQGMPMLRGVWWTPSGDTPRLVWSTGRSAAPDAAGTVNDEAADAQGSADASGREGASADDELAVAASFVQVNAGVASLLHAHVLETVLASGPTRVIDAYAGAGRLAVSLAARGVHVTAIERDARACAFAEHRLGASGRVLCGRVEDRLAECGPADVVVLNPPRAGCDAAVTAWLADARAAWLADARAAGRAPARVVYVSCDPATLARDVKRLAGWRVASVTCFDLFPQTAHVETVCVLQPEAA